MISRVRMKEFLDLGTWGSLMKSMGEPDEVFGWCWLSLWVKMMKSFGKPGEVWVKLINSVDEVDEVYQ